MSVREVEKAKWYVLMPNSTFKTTWNIIIIFLLLYTSTVVPYQVAFTETENNSSKLLNYAVDILFGFDIIINFISAYETDNDRRVET